MRRGAQGRASRKALCPSMFRSEGLPGAPKAAHVPVRFGQAAAPSCSTFGYAASDLVGRSRGGERLASDRNETLRQVHDSPREQGHERRSAMKSVCASLFSFSVVLALTSSQSLWPQSDSDFSTAQAMPYVGAEAIGSDAKRLGVVDNRRTVRCIPFLSRPRRFSAWQNAEWQCRGKDQGRQRPRGN